MYRLKNGKKVHFVNVFDIDHEEKIKEFQQTITLLLEEMNKMKGEPNGQSESNDGTYAEPDVKSSVSTGTKNDSGKK